MFIRGARGVVADGGMLGIEQLFTEVAVVVRSALDQGTGILEVAIDGLHGHSDAVLLHCDISITLQSVEMSTYRTNLFTNGFGTVNLLLVGGSIAQRLGEDLDSQFAHGRSDTEGFNPVSPEELIAEEWLNDCRDARCVSCQHVVHDAEKLKCSPRKLAPVVPAPPWWQAASICLNSQS